MDNEYAGETTEIKPAGWPKPIGVLSLVFGILAVTCGVAGTGLSFFSESFAQTMSFGQLPPATPPFPMMPSASPLFIASGVLGVIVNIVLIVAGIRLLKRQQQGRTLHLAYALLGVLAAFVGTYAGYVGQQDLLASQAAWAEQYGEASDYGKQIAAQVDMQQQCAGTSQAVGSIIGLAGWLAWPVFCIIWFGMAKKVVPPAYGN